MKIKAVSELQDSTYRTSLKNAGVYLEIFLLDCLTTKKFQDFPGLVGTMLAVVELDVKDSFGYNKEIKRMGKPSLQYKLIVYLNPLASILLI